MIIFKTITIQNFLSFGDTPTTFQLDRNGETVLITGKNGGGKSSISIEALLFALFGKSFRGINKSNLTNTINKKGCLVKLVFCVGEDSFELDRGMSPNVLSLKKNSTPIDMGGSAKDFQIQLEKIIGFDYDTAIRTMVVGFANYKPFMQMTVPERRAFSDAVLGVGALTEIAASVRADRSRLATESSTAQVQFDSLKEQYQSKMSTIDKLESVVEEVEANNDEEITSLRAKINTNALAMLVHEATMKVNETASAKVDELNLGMNKLTGKVEVLMQKVRDEEKKKEFYKDNDTCPTCSGVIDHDHKMAHMVECDSIIDSSKAQLKSLSEIRTKITESQQVAKSRLLEYQRAKSSVMELEGANKMIQRQIDILSVKIEKKTPNQEIIDILKSECKELATKIVVQRDKSTTIKNELEVVSAASNMLKDDGIRASVIREYIPVVNQLVNSYLDALDFWIRIDLDENFNDTLRGRFVDEFSYSSLSQGERQRIDLAMLFAWRKVAAICSGVDTNILILDEVADSAMDSEGVEALMDIRRAACEGQTVLIVSHRVEMGIHCDAVVTVTKVDGFSKIS